MASYNLHQEKGLEDEIKRTTFVQTPIIYLDPRPNLILMPNEMQAEICTHLSTASLAKLALTGPIIGNSASRILYRRNAKEENSSAVAYAIVCSAKKYGEKCARKIIRKAMSFGAQLNVVHYHSTKSQTYATALHMASALGYCSIVKLLLEGRASVTLPSRNLWAMVPFDAGQKTRIIAKAARCLIQTREWCQERVKADLARVEWLPLFIPFLLGYKHIVDLLLCEAPDCRLTSNFHGQGCGALTALHVISATKIQDERLVERVMELSRGLLDEKLPGDGGSALHIALRHRNELMIEKLLQQRANLNLQTYDLGHTPMHTAISCCYEAENPVDRKVYQRSIELLVNEGADMNKTTLAEGHTPLMALVDAAEWDWKLSHFNIKQLIHLFLDNGCHLNRMAANGETFIHRLIKRIAEKKGNISLESLLIKAIDKGARLDIPLPNGKSIARAFVVEPGTCPRLAKILSQRGAKIYDHEVDDGFFDWFFNPQFAFRFGEGIIKEHRERISQHGANRAYLHAVSERSQKLIDELRDVWGLAPSNAHRLVLEALRDPTRTSMEFVLSLDFDANRMHSALGSYLHVIVNQMREVKYTEKVAMANAKALIDRGASVLKEDTNGKTVIQVLREMDEELGQVNDKLRLMLLDQKDRERGEF